MIAEPSRIHTFLCPMVIIIEVPFWFEDLRLVEVVGVIPPICAISEHPGEDQIRLTMFMKMKESLGIW